MPTLSSVPEDDAKAKAGLSTRKIVDELKTAALLGTDVTYEVLADYIRHKTQSIVNQQIKSVLDELEGEMAIDDQPLPKRGEVDPDIHVEVTHRVEGRNALRQVQRKAIQKIRSRYE